MFSLELEEETGTEATIKQQKNLIGLIKQMDKDTRKVANVIAENPNTKRELKES